MCSECIEYINKYLYKLWVKPQNKYKCIIATPNKLIQIFHNDIKYHIKMRYIYFDTTNLMEKYILYENNEILIRFINKINNDITKFEFNLNEITPIETKYNNEYYKEWIYINNNHKLIFRLNTKNSKSSIILCISREFI